MSDEYTKINVNIGGCKNCVSCLHHLLEKYADIKEYIISSEENLISIHPVYVKRVTSLLKFVGLDIKDVDNHLSVYSKDSKAESNDDIYFLPELNDNSQINSMASKRKRLDGHHIMKRNDHCIIASKLVAILPHEVECCRPHLVPGWCVAVHSEHHLSKINQYLQSFVPLPGELSHIKRIDSCRSYENKSTYVFLQIAKSSYTWLDANETLNSMVDLLQLNSSDHQFISTSPTPCWIPLHAPITRKHQLLYSFSNESQEKRFSSFKNSLNEPIILGWPSTLRACPELEELVNVGRSLSLSCFSELELKKHSLWLKRVSTLSKQAQELSDIHPQSCAGVDGPACAVIIVDPESNIALAESTTPTITSDISWLDHAALLAVSAVAKLKQNTGNQYSDSYLCTGFDAYFSLEPCLMCGMALLHNRIRRVFCCQKLAGDGAFSNASRLHVQEQLNHRFRVFSPP
ncbi:unnamed protein product [Schistosoma margrebowiei]|uniref:CMP/dCMP-type deaminase domain-containing protein n=1 Tax=Schistosoma margrebowiei TaxID=48269 RepID=A0AA84ZTR6_9TREM|nr:unnamed protein product [Schistosoma margrebowiei]